MNNRQELEYPRPGEEFSPPGEEFTPPRQEFDLPGDEYQNSFTCGDEKRCPKKRLIWMAAALLVTLRIALPGAPVEVSPSQSQAVEVESSESQPTEPQPIEVTPDDPEPVPAEPDEAPTQTVTETAETLPSPPTYPMGDGTLEITVYNDSIDMENNWSNLVLYEGSFPESDFTELVLPEPKPEDGFEFLGFVMYGGKDGDGQPHYYPVETSITADDVSLVAPREDGVRHIAIYAAWHCVDGGEPWMPLTLDGNGGTPTVQYDATDPMASGGTVYLCAYPVPQRPGYLFAGWYLEQDCSGTPVEALPAVSFFDVQDGSIAWNKSIPITLYARWIPE